MFDVKIILEIFLIFILPVLLWYYKIIPIERRLHALYGMNILALIFVFIHQFNLKQIGVRLDNIYSSLFIYSVFTLIGAIVVFAGAKIIKIKKPGEGHSIEKLWHCIKISVLQETIYRGYLMALLLLILSPITAIILNALLFTLVHVIYENKKVTLFIVFISGLAFAALYAMHPNLILISITHIILNYVAISLGFFELPKKTKSTV